MPKMKHLLRKLHIGGGCNNGSHHPSPPPTAEVTPPLSSSSASLESALMRIRAVESAENLVDFNFFEEEFQVQLALAISVSDPDSREDPETVQIKDTKQISLGFLDRLVSTLEEKKHHQVKLKEGLKDLSAKRMELQNSLTSLWPKQVFLLHPPISVSEGDDLNINFPMDRSKENHRLMKVELSYEIKKSAGTLLPPFRNKFYIE